VSERVIVVGAGPAGCAASYALASRGVPTLLLESQTIPRPKTCAGGLSPWTIPLLAQLGLRERVTEEAHLIHGARLWTAPDQLIRLRGGLEAAVLPRERLDALLADAARAAGAELRQKACAIGLLREGVRVVGVETPDGPLEAAAVVIATGAQSRLAKELPEADPFFGIMAWYEGDENTDEMDFYVDPKLGLQYGWVFPEGEGRINLGLCYHRGAGRPNARFLLDRFIERYLGRRLRGLRPRGAIRACPIRASAWPVRLAAEGVLYVGEAAGLADAMTGEGIYHALVSGRLAGLHLAELLQRGRSPTSRSLARYSAEAGLRLGPQLLLGQSLLGFFRSPVMPPLLKLTSLGPVRALAEHVFRRVT